MIDCEIPTHLCGEDAVLTVYQGSTLAAAYAHAGGPLANRYPMRLCAEHLGTYAAAQRPGTFMVVTGGAHPSVQDGAGPALRYR